MSENELDEILKEVRKRANANTPIEPPMQSAPKADAKPDFDVKLNEVKAEPKKEEDFDILSLLDGYDNSEPSRGEQYEEPPKRSKKGLIIAIAVIVIAVIACVGTYFALSNSKDEPEKEPTSSDAAPAPTVVDKNINPLTGENGYNAQSIGKRPVAVVVENEYSTEAVRPQWGISDADIVLEGESEFSTRLLLFWADSTDVPEMVGPTRSARPPFIRFSQLFDCVFIHAGLSRSKDNYIGADAVFRSEDVDHINLLDLTEDGVYFGRNNDRYTAVEHTGFLNGTNLPKLIEKSDIDMTLDSSSFTQFKFYDKPTALGSESANSCSFKWSQSYCAKTAKFTYDTALHKYVTTDFDSRYGESGVQFENLLFLFDETQYIVKENYKDGQSETYCDYKLSGGSGKILSEGTAVDITWGVSDGKLWMKTADGEQASLNVGKTYIGYGSSNNGGSLNLNPQETVQ